MNRSQSFYDLFPVTSFLMLFVLAFYGLEFIEQLKWVREQGEGGGTALLGVSFSVLDSLGSFSTYHVTDGQYWRLLSSAFLHGGLIHLFFNCVVLSDMGRVCEPLLSTWRFVTVYVCSAIGSSGFTYIWYVFIAGRPNNAVGASGALCGLIGLLLAFSIRHRQDVQRDSLLRWVVMIAILSFLIPQISWTGHLGGFIVGLAFGWFTREYTTSATAARWRYPGYAAAAATVVALGFAIWNYFANPPFQG